MTKTQKIYSITIIILLLCIFWTVVSIEIIINKIDNNLYNFIEAYQETIIVETSEPANSPVLPTVKNSIDFVEDRKELSEIETPVLINIPTTKNSITFIDYEKEIVEIEIKEIVKTPEDIIDDYIYSICELYPKVKPELVQSIIYHESRYNPKATNGACVGLMQVSTYWHAGRAIKLGVTDFYDPYSNILLGVDYLSEMFEQYEDSKLVLMLYNMKRSTAFDLYNSGQVSIYAKSVIAKTDEYKKPKVQ